MTEPIFEITKAAGFDAAHHLPGSPRFERHGSLHGHSFRVEATLKGPAAPPLGWVEDLDRMGMALDALAGELDHTTLNDHPGLASPTLETLCLFFAQRLKPDFPSLIRVAVSRPSVDESCLLNC
jgi:6-pyruvoyltetrahydropterin/6-carboxytetrahydropterin synthase